MFQAKLFKNLSGGLGLASLHLTISFCDRCDGFLEIVFFPCEIFSERRIERVGGILAVPLGKLFKLCHTLGAERNHRHALRVGREADGVNSCPILLGSCRTVSGALHS